MKKNIFTLFVLLFFVLKVISQPINKYINNVVLPAPNANALGKFTEISTDEFRGVPNISIPIHTIKEGPLGVNVSLDYHASGIRAAEVSSWVGTGWALRAGGMISRTVLGLADEKPNGYYLEGKNLDESYLEQSWVATGYRDAEPDIFSFNFDGYSGKFFFDKDNNVHLVPKQDLKVSVRYESNEFVWFEIITPKGDKYYFGNIPNINYHTNEGIEKTILRKDISENYDYFLGPELSWCILNTGTFEDKEYTSTWYLVKIQSSDNESCINLNYVSEDYSYKMPASFTMQIRDGNLVSENFSSKTSYPYDNFWNNKRYYDVNKIRGKRLTTISSNRETIHIEALDDRLDIDELNGNRAKKLNQIQLQSGGYCIRWILEQSYFNAGNLYPERSESKRLRLDKITKKSCDGVVSENSYQFNYEGSYLPNRLTYAIDAWGYYNGVNSNDTKAYNIPGWKGLTPGVLAPENNFIVDNGSDRRAYEEPMKKGVLTKIKYPTGGSINFQYEANRFYKENTDSIVKVNNLITCPSPTDGCCTGNQKTSDIFSYPHQPSINISKFYLKIIMAEPFSSCSPNLVRIELLKDNVFLDSETWEVTPLSNPLLITGYIKDYFELTPNTNYQIRIFSNGAQGEFKLWTQASINEEHYYLTGGLRVKEVRIDPDDIKNEKSIIRNYEYLDHTNSCSGVLMNNYVVFGYRTPCGTFLTDNPVAPLSSFEGYHIGYRNVTEKFNGTGKTYYSFNIQPWNYSFEWIALPIPPNFKNGTNLSTHSYKENNGYPYYSNYENGNDYNSLLSIDNRAYRTLLCSPYHPINPGCGYGVLHKSYRLKTGYYRIEKTTQKLDGVESVKNFVYGNGDDILLPKLIKWTNSDGKAHISESKYAKDFQNNPVCSLMVEKNMVYLPIETTKKIDGNLISGKKIEYGLFNGLNPYPEKISTIEGGNWVLDGTYGSYTLGKPSTFTKTNYPTSSLTWDGDNLTSISYSGHTTNYLYYPNTKLLQKITEPDGQTKEYKYDNLLRLSKETLNNTINKSYTYTYQPNLITNSTNYGDAEINTSTLYDGLGREIETTKIGYGPNKNDIKYFTKYDNFGSVEKETYLPGNFISYEYEKSPLRRLLIETYPDGGVKSYQYKSNNIVVQKADNSGIYWPNQSPYFYDQNTLYNKISFDENGHKTESYYDIANKLVLTRRPAGISKVTGQQEYADTYYGYNSSDFLAGVKTPEEKLYTYSYNSQDLISSKTIPGKGTNSLTYNNRKNLETDTDPKGQVLTYSYDDFDRITSVKNGANELIKNIYDVGPIINVGKLVNKEVAILGDNNNINGKITTEIEYDNIFGRMKKDKSTRNITGSSSVIDETNITYSNAGWVKTNNKSIGLNTGTFPINSTMEYDHSGRLKNIDYLIGNNFVPKIGEYEYNDFDKMKTHYISLPTKYRAQKREYEYTTRGWLTKINKMPLPGKTATLKTCNEEKNPYDRNDLTDSTSCQLCDYDSGLIESLSTIYGIYVNGKYMNLPHYPYNPFFASLTLKVDIENWLTSNGFVYKDVFVDIYNEFYRIRVTQTNAVFNYIELRGGSGSAYVTDFTSSNCNGGKPFICDFESEFFSDTFNIDALWYTTSLGSNMVPLNYQYGNLTNKPLSMFVTDLQNWLIANNHQGTVSIVGSNPFAVSITGTDVQFYKIGLKGYQDCYGVWGCPCNENIIYNGGADLCAGLVYFNQTCEQFMPNGNNGTDTLMVLQPQKDICDICESKGYPCYNCPFNKLGMDSCAICQNIHIDDCNKCKNETDICTKCQNLGYEDCSTCPLTVNRVMPQELVIEYNLNDLQTGNGVSMPNMKLNTNYQTHDGDIELGSSTHNILLHNYGSATNITINSHILSIPLNDIIIENTNISNAITTLQNKIHSALNNISATNIDDVNTIISSVITTAQQDWGMASLAPTIGPPTGQSEPPTLFALDLRYDSPETYYSVAPQRNGNISTMSWQVYNRNKFHYAFNYDPLDRILKGSFAEISSNVKRGLYDESLEYDKDGNITELKRNGEIGSCRGTNTILYGAMDRLSYSYSNNRVTKIEDEGSGKHGFKAPPSPLGFYSDYSYDNNGNMSQDGAKGLNTNYNILNLPSKISTTTDNTTFLYSAEGEKIRVMNNTGKWTDYFDGALFNELGSLIEATTPEGRAVPYTNAPGGLLLEGIHKDHLGNNRVIFSDIDGNGIIDNLTDDDPENIRNFRQELHYYPFGLEFSGPWKTTGSTKPTSFRYNGKESEPYGWDDFGARRYDPVVGRWWSVDPLAELKYECTPYNYTTNNPILNIDPDGRFDFPPLGTDLLTWEDEDGSFVRDNTSSDNLWRYKDGDYLGQLLDEVEIIDEHPIDNFSENSRKVISNLIGLTDFMEDYGHIDNLGEAFIGVGYLYKDMGSIASTMYGAGAGWKGLGLLDKTIKVADIGVDASSLYYKSMQHKIEAPPLLLATSAAFSASSIINSYKKPNFGNFSDFDDLAHYIYEYFK